MGPDGRTSWLETSNVQKRTRVFRRGLYYDGEEWLGRVMAAMAVDGLISRGQRRRSRKISFSKNVRTRGIALIV